MQNTVSRVELNIITELNIIGRVKLSVSCYEVSEEINFVVVQQFGSNLILGFDFWEKFGLGISRIRETMMISHEWKIEMNLAEVEMKRMLCALEMLLISTPEFWGRTNVLVHDIELAPDAKPFVVRPHHYSPAIEKKVGTELQRMIGRKVIGPSNSCCASTIVPIDKSDGTVRLCLDSRKLNEITVRDQFPQQNPQRIFARIESKCKYFSVIDLKEAANSFIRRKENGKFCIATGTYCVCSSRKGLISI